MKFSFGGMITSSFGRQLAHRGILTAALACALPMSFASSVLAERPTAPQLFPAQTLVYVRVDDSRDMKAKMSEASTGKMFNDPELKPIVDELYGSAIKLTAQMQEVIGVNLEELLAIPNGEMAFGFYFNEKKPAIVALLEAGDELPALEIILSRAEEQAAREADRTEEKVGDITLVIWKNRNRADQEIAYFIDQGVFVAASQVDAARKLADVWQGKTGEGKEKYKTLAENRKFLTVMSQCVGSEGERPQASFYVDPIAIVKESINSSGNAGGAAVLAILPALGVDGLQSVGGSVILGTKEFESIIHGHIQLASPRRGLMEVLRPKNGSTTPENWVPADVGSYMTLNWDVPKTVSSVAKIVDNFQGEDWFKGRMEQAGERFDIKIQEDIIDQIAGRMTIVQGFVKPFRMNSGTNLFAVQLKDPVKFKESVLPKINAFIEKEARGGAVPQAKTGTTGTFYFIEVGGQRENGPSPEVIRRPKLCYGVMGDYFFFSDDTYLIDEIISAEEGRRDLLADDEDYKMISDKVKEQLREKESSVLMFQRPEESLRVFYEMARDPANKQRLQENSANNPVFAALAQILEKHELPPFSVVEKYLTPTGAFVTEDESGLHYTAFSLKRE
jgi:hypothetical protein